MAKAEAVTAPPAGDTDAGSGGRKKLLLIVGLAVLLIGAGVGGYLFWKSRQSEHAAPAKAAPPAPLLFHPLDPAFVVNFPGDQSVRFLQIEVRVGSRDAATIELLKANDPVIRNDLLMMLASQQAADLSTQEGRQKLRTTALDTIRRIVKSAGGEPASVEAVFFTSFVMQ